MKGTVMIKISQHLLFNTNQSTLRSTSEDNSTGSECFMTQSDITVVSFDNVKKEYVRNLGLTEIPKSNDALVIDSDDKATFIEFKNGCINRNDVYDLRKKIYDSLLIFSDITGFGISKTRDNMDYILVYNKDKNPNICSNETVELSTNVQDSDSRDTIAKEFSKMAKTNFVKLGLEKFKKYCFSNVYTYTVQEFEEYYINTKSINKK